MTSPMAASSRPTDDEITMEKNAGLIMGVSPIFSLAIPPSDDSSRPIIAALSRRGVWNDYTCLSRISIDILLKSPNAEHQPLIVDIGCACEPLIG